MAQTKVKLISDGVIDVNHLALGHSITTDNIGEGSNLYYTDARVSTYLSTNNYATEGYVTTAVANLVDSAPTTLDTLNELAAALGDDPNFATTVTNSIATKLPLAGGTLTGNLGIGKVPSEKLDIEGASPFIRISNTDETESGIVFVDSASAAQSAKITYDSGASNAFIFYNNAAAERMRIDSSGNVGIGEQVPDTKLHVNSGGTNNVATFESTDSFANVFIKDNTGSFQISKVGTDVLLYTESSTTHGNMRFLSNSSTERMRIDSSGNVGIGTTALSSGAKLDVNGHLSIANGSQINLTRTLNTNNLWYGMRYSSDEVQIYTYDAANRSITFNTANGTNVLTGQLMKIQADGKVGIGTTSPAAKLEVFSRHSTTEPTVDIGSYSVSNNQPYGMIAMSDPYHGLVMRGYPNTSSNYGVTYGDYMSFFEYGGIFRFYKKQPSVLSTIAEITDTNTYFDSSVGIGTTSPSTKLDVNGPTKTDSLWLNNYTGWRGTDTPEGWAHVIATGTISSSTTGGTSLNILSIYTDGHWGGGVYGEIWIISAYYGAAYKRYSYQANRAGYVTLTLLEENGYENYQTLDISSASIIGSGTHGGQNVAKSVIRLNTTNSYTSSKAIIKIGKSDNSNKIFDNRSSDAAVTADRVTNGGAYHFRSVDLTGMPFVSLV